MRSELIIIIIINCIHELLWKKKLCRFMHISLYNLFHTGTCSDGYLQIFGSCYKVFLDEVTWAQAGAVCAADDAHLVVIESYLEMLYLITTLPFCMCKS